MNRQEVFDRVATQLLTQNEKSQVGISCLYRWPRGLRCAIGALISDEAYKPSLEDSTPFEDHVLAALNASGVNINTWEDRKFIDELQDVHDDNEPEVWSRVLRAFADKYHIDTSALGTAQPVAA